MNPIVRDNKLYVPDEMAPELAWAANDIGTKLIGPDYEGEKDDYGCEVIGKIHLDNSRWDEIEYVIIRYQGRFYSAVYVSGLTEYQETDGFDTTTIDGVEYAEFHEVAPQETLITKWKKV